MAIEGRQALGKLQAAELTHGMDCTSGEEFAEELLKEQGTDDVAEFFAGSTSANGDG